MVLAKKVPMRDIKIIATDLDEQVLEKAKDGVYGENSIKGLPKEFQDKYFEKMGDRFYKISDDIKRCVEFKKSNLVYEKFNKSLVTDGCLFVGNTEQIIGYRDMGYSYDHLFFYRKTN